jgi:hypothetical protein
VGAEWHPDLVDASPGSEFAPVGIGADDVVLSSSRGHFSFASASAGSVPEAPQAEHDPFEMREHTFVKTNFSKRTSFSHAILQELMKDCI